MCRHTVSPKTALARSPVVFAHTTEWLRRGILMKPEGSKPWGGFLKKRENPFNGFPLFVWIEKPLPTTRFSLFLLLRFLIPEFVEILSSLP